MSFSCTKNIGSNTPYRSAFIKKRNDTGQSLRGASAGY
jgi:hypothetical protein